MERTLSQEERIRRAEEIYYRRKSSSGNGVRVSSDRVNVKKSKLSLFKKMILQLAICAVIYVIFYLIKNTNYVFSEDVVNKTKELLSYDINFQNAYSQFVEFMENGNQEENGEVVENEVNVQENSIGNEISNETTNETTNETVNEAANEILNENSNEINEGKTNTENTLGIGGAEVNEVIEVSSNSNSSKKTQMELDAEYVKQKCSFKIPLKGTVTSRYGKREPTDIISANHQGIDIGADTGTAIYASMEGTVTLVSSEGDYGKHVEITNGKIMTRYAHCSKITVKKGAKIKQGQKIAEVGETGKATGPHLHFEIWREKRTINPEYVLKFD